MQNISSRFLTMKELEIGKTKGTSYIKTINFVYQGPLVFLISNSFMVKKQLEIFRIFSASLSKGSTFVTVSLYTVVRNVIEREIKRENVQMKPPIEYNVKVTLIMCPRSGGQCYVWKGPKTFVLQNNDAVPNLQTPFSENCHRAIWLIFVVKSSITWAMCHIFNLILQPHKKQGFYFGLKQHIGFLYL